MPPWRHQYAQRRRRCVATKGAPCSGRRLAAVEAHHLAATYVACCCAAGSWGWVWQLATRRRSFVVGRRRRRRHLHGRLTGNEVILPLFGAVARRWLQLQTRSGDAQLPVIIVFLPDAFTSARSLMGRT